MDGRTPVVGHHRHLVPHLGNLIDSIDGQAAWATGIFPGAPHDGRLRYYPKRDGAQNGIPAEKEKHFMDCRIAKLEEQMTRLPAMAAGGGGTQGKYILVTHSAVIRHLCEQFMGDRKPDNIGMVPATIRT